MDDTILRENEILLEHQDFFQDNFDRALDSAFSADIACCDSCYDSFVSFWPLANEANEAEFQRSQIDIDTFYSNSRRLQECYTEEEYDVLKFFIRCPRCGSQIDANMWVYELPFAYDIDILDFELDIETMEQVSRETPFLLLNNEFARNVHDLLHDLSESTNNVVVDHSLFRARISTQVDQLDYSQFSVAPKQFIQEGRYNHAGEQALYLASDHDTCFNEVGNKLCYIAECKLEQPIKILDLSEPDVSHAEKSEELAALTYSALMSKKLSTQGYDKPVYIFTRFIADCAKSAGFDAIKYPSTKSIGNNFNLVIINKDVFENSINFLSLSLRDGDNIYTLST
ncbi:TPA: RES family NAD+ phosphorylase [Vibrio vulnificus]|nr:RES family NAD+ phosphorylase [Vibrio vulnificus]